MGEPVLALSRTSQAGVTMVRCSDFLREYSDYRDGLIDPARGDALDAHRAGCVACAEYDRVVRDGVDELHAALTIEPSDDFIPRLQHRLYNLDAGVAEWGRANGSGTSAGFVLLLVLLIGAAAWLPVVTHHTPTVELPPVLAVGPTDSTPVHRLFQAGPLLTPPSDPAAFERPDVRTVFFQYTRLGASASLPFRGQPH